MLEVLKNVRCEWNGQKCLCQMHFTYENNGKVVQWNEKKHTSYYKSDIFIEVYT